MSNIDTFNLLLTVGIILLIAIQLVLIVTAFVIVTRIKKIVTDIKNLADTGEEIVRELGERVKRHASMLSILNFVVKKGMKLRKEAKR